MENILFDWTMNNMPTIAVFLAFMWLTGWISIRIVDHRQKLIDHGRRISKVEKDGRMLRRSVRRLDEKVVSLDRRIDDVEVRLTHKIDDVEVRLTHKIDDVEVRLTHKMEQMETRLERKIDDIAHTLDKLVLHLTVTQKIELKD